MRLEDYDAARAFYEKLGMKEQRRILEMEL